MSWSEDIQQVYFIGIGGIGMSALARYFTSMGVKVDGYDRNCTTLTKELEAEGMTIHYDLNTSHVPENTELVVYTPAISKENRVYKYCLTKGWPVLKRAEVLGKLSEDKFTIAVAGTHGKTTITAMLGHLLSSAFDASAFIGGIALNYKSNFIKGSGDILVVEADEYDRSFHHLHPDIAIVTAIDDDHLDIYGTRDALLASYQKFVNQIKRGGTLLLHHGLEIDTSRADLYVRSYSSDIDDAAVFITELKQENGAYHYKVKTKKSVSDYVLNIGGLYNTLNTLPVIAIGQELQMEDEQIAKSLASFSGIRRRFEYIIKSESRIFIDDYAHHPKEIKVLMEAVRDLFPKKKITAVFQPHLFSRTEDHAEGFAESLSLADEVVLLEIYPAREQPIIGVSSAMIKEKLNNCSEAIQTKESLPQTIENINPELLVTVGAGDIDTLLSTLQQILLTKPPINA